VINIDHHISNTRFGTYNWVDPEAAAAGEMIYHLIEEMGTSLSREIATNLYVAILTDTGSFHYANTTPRALRVAAALIEAGVVPQKVAGVAWMEVTQQMLEQEGLGKDALEGLINYPRSIKGVAVALLFKEEAREAVRVCSSRKNRRRRCGSVSGRRGT
jgi:phosphoesterase RecJ-like protein